jgi:hypothetical protein
LKYAALILGLVLVVLAGLGWAGNPVPGDMLSVLQGVGLAGFVLLHLGIAGLRKATRAGFIIAVVLAIPLAVLLAFAGRALNVRNHEALMWSYPQRTDTSAEWRSYLYSMGSMHEALRATRERTEALTRVTKVLAALPSESKAHEPVYALKVHLEQTGGIDRDASWWLDTFTPVRAHFEEATRRYGEARFREVMKKKDTSELRAYRLEFPGQHVEDTAAALRKKYADARKRYDALIDGKQTDAAAVAGIRALLATENLDAFVVPVVFLQVAGLEAPELEALVKRLGVREVFPVAPSFTEQRNAGRQHAVVWSMNKAIAPVAGDLFSLSEIALEDASDRIVVAQKVFPSGSVYSPVADRDKPISEQSVSIGIAMAFDCTVETRGHPRHRFSMVAKPASEISTAKMAGSEIYHAMANSAFDDFRVQLLRAYGF